MSSLINDANAKDYCFTIDENILKKRSISVKDGDKKIRVYFNFNRSITGILGTMNTYGFHLSAKDPQKVYESAGNSNYSSEYMPEEEAIARRIDFINLCILYNNTQLVREVVANAPRTEDGSLDVNKIQHIAYEGTVVEGFYRNDLYADELCAVNRENNVIEMDISHTKFNRKTLSLYKKTPTCREILDAHKDLPEASFGVQKTTTPVIEAFCKEEFERKPTQSRKLIVKIPEGTKYVVKNAFYREKTIIEAIIPEGVEEIGSHAFSDCENLLNVQLPSTLKKIEDNAFYGCKNLTKLQLPDSLTVIGYYAFYDCKNLTELQLPDSLTEIGDHAFYGSNLKELQLPDSLTKIGHDAFGIPPAHIKIPESVYIGEYAFHDFLDDRPPQRREGNLILNDKEFFGCCDYNTENIIIPEGILSIPGYVPDHAPFFLNCREVTLPDSLVYIGSGALRGLKTIHHLPKSLRYIAPGALVGCESLGDLEPIFKKQPYHSQPIYIENGEVVDMGYHVTNGLLYRGNTLIGCVGEQPECMVIEPGTVEVDFDACSDIINGNITGRVKVVIFPDSVKRIKRFNIRPLEEVVLPEGLEVIENDCFKYSELKELYIPDSVKYSGYLPYSSHYIRRMYVSRKTVLWRPGNVTIIYRD